MMGRDDKAAMKRMDERHRRVLWLVGKAHGIGDFAGVDPDPEAEAQLKALLDAPLSGEEMADLEVVGWKPNWRKNVVGFACMMLDLSDDFEVSAGPGMAPVDPSAKPQTRH